MTAIEHDFTAVNGNLTTTSSSATDVTGASIASGEFTAGKKYWLRVTAQVAPNVGAERIRVQVVHGTTAFPESVGELMLGTAADRGTYSWFTVWTAVASEAIKLQFWRSSGTGTINIDQVAMFSMNLSDNVTENTDWFFNERATDDALGSAGFTAGAAVTFTPGTASHDWLVEAFSYVDMAASTNLAISRIGRSGEASSSLPLAQYDAGTGSGFVQITLSRVFSLGTVSNTFTQESSSSVASGEVRLHSSIFALNLNKFAAHANAYTEAAVVLSGTAFATQLQTASITPTVTSDVVLGSYFSFDQGGNNREAKMRVQVDNADQPAGQTTDTYNFQIGEQATAEGPFSLVTMSTSLSAAAHTIDLDASVDTSGVPTGQHRTLWAFTAELPAAGGAFQAAWARGANTVLGSGGRALRKNVASQTVGAQMITAADGSAFTSAVTIRVTGDGGTQATGSVGSGACTHEGNGYHSYAPAQAETNYDHVAFTFTGTGAIPATVQIYTTYPQTGDNYARLGAPAGASVSADIAAVKAQTAAIEVDTQDIQARLPAALVSGRIDASVGAMAAGVVTAAAIATDAIDSDAIAASAVTEIQSGLATSAAVAALPTAATTADAVWDEDATAHQTQGTFGQAIGDPVADTNTIYKAVVTDATAATVGLDVVDLKTQIGTAGAGLTAADDAVMTRLGTPAGASVSVDIAAVKTQTAAIETDTQDIQARLPAALVSGRIDASVGAMAAGTVTAAAIATDAIDSDAIAASAVTEIQSGLATAAALTVVDDLIDTEVGAIKTVTDKLDTAMELDGAVYRFTTNALEQAPTGGSAPTAAAIADAVWDEAISGHLTAGSTGAALNAAGSAGDPWTTPLPGAYGSGTAGKIIGDNVNATISSRATQTSVDTVDTVVDAIKLKTDNLPSDPADASVVAGLIAGVETKVDTVDTVVDAIKLKTDNLPSDPADASVIAGRFDTLDTSVADLPTNAELATSQAAADDATLAAIATLQTSVNDLPTNAELATALAGADDATLAAIADLPTNAELATALGTADDATLAAIAALAVSVADLPTNAELATSQAAADDATLAAIATVDTVVDAIKAKTDSLTFTVAGQVDANVQAINDAELTGDGDTTPWGPA